MEGGRTGSLAEQRCEVISDAGVEVLLNTFTIVDIRGPYLARWNFFYANPLQEWDITAISDGGVASGLLPRLEQAEQGNGCAGGKVERSLAEGHATLADERAGG